MVRQDPRYIGPAEGKDASVHTLLKLAQLRWNENVTKMPVVRLATNVFFEELHEGKRFKSGQQKRFKDTIKASLKNFNIPIQLYPGNRLHIIG